MKDFLNVMEEGSRLAPGVGQDARNIERFDEKLAGFLELIQNKPGYSSHRRRYLMKEAETTSDFPTLFGTVLERTLLAKYQIAKPDWRGYIKTGTQNDFRSAQLIGMYGLQANLPVVKERGEYKNDKLQDGKFSISLQKYGKTFGLSWEAMINDDLGAFSDVASRLADSALRTEALQASLLYSGASGPNTTLFNTAGTHPIDGLAFANKGTSPLSATALAATITLMKQQKDADGMPIIINRFHVVVPVNKEFLLAQLLSQNLLIATALSSSSATGTLGTTSENVIAKYPITAHTNPFLDTVTGSANGQFEWYVFADPQQDGAAVQMNFLRGHENPEIVQKESNKLTLGGASVSPLEGDFDSDSMLWRVRHVLGGIQLDPRYAYAQAATS